MGSDQNPQRVFILMLLLSTTTSLGSPDGKGCNEPSIRQNSFYEWLISIFQTIPPFQIIFPTTTPKPVTISPSDKCSSCSCGTINKVKRIVNGQEVQVNQYPWMAMLLFRDRFYCGGSLINDRYVVSAAHCLKPFPKPFITVRLLAHQMGDKKMQVITRSAEKVVWHPLYSAQNNDNDIGLIKLNKKVEMSSLLRPVCMPMAQLSYADEEGIVTGWGATSEGGPLAQSLLEVRVPILSQMACHQSKYGKDRITDNMLCAGYDEGGKDSCQGDSGGPLHVNNVDLNTYHLVGVVSWGEGCARKGYPGVYTRVSEYLQWIDENSKDSCKCNVPSKRMEAMEILL
ncbi:trypsin-1-like [Haematobia irritans]|uniref:trypsin-1-like n=1 Tax=Haematobia irritans TaxID=7368 RepID=UPI003F4F8B7C